MGKATRRRDWAVVLLVCAAFEMAACSGPALSGADDAEPRLQQLSADLTDVLLRDYPGQPWLPVSRSESRVAKDRDGKCVLYMGTLRSQDSVTRLARGWDAVMETINPVLERSGFAKVTDTDSLKGGWTGISSTDKLGAQLRIFEKSYTEIALQAEVAETAC